MGCNNSREAVSDASGTKAKPSEKQTSLASAANGSSGKLLDKYALGKVLGQGAFGVVYKCKKKGTDEEYAVKMIDQVETPLAEIKKEAEMLLKLSHPSCIKLHDVYYEKVFVCMVLEFYKGGDMIQGMMAHWKTKGMIPIANVKFLSKQMHDAVAWIHSKQCVHRDVKGDNFMMGEPLVENPNQRLYLSDFGTVRELEKGERCTQKCGTKNYWPPEFFKLNYGMKVDCWAVGVVMFGLVSGKFPFKGEDDVKFKKLTVPRRCPEDGSELIHGLLERDEAKRVDCNTAVGHSFICDQGSTAGQDAGEPKDDNPKDFKPQIKETGANAGVAQRRAELVDRLQNAGPGKANRRDLQVRADVHGQEFTVTDPVTERSTTFQWWASSKTSDMVETYAKARQLPTNDMANREVTEQSVRHQLVDHNVKVDGFGKGPAKSFNEFVTELQVGSSRLLLDSTKYKFVVRAVDIVMLRIAYTTSDGKKRFVIDTTEGLQEGRTTPGSALPQNLKLPQENALQAAGRLAKDMLGMGDCQIKWQFEVETLEESMDSAMYPGIQTVYRKEIMFGEVTTTNQKILQRLGVAAGKEFSHRDGTVQRSFQWMLEPQCNAKKILIGKPDNNSDFSALVYPPIGLEEDELNEFLSKNHIDTSKWGEGTYKSLEDFSEELVKGESTLIQQAGGRVARVVDIVVLQLIRQETGDILVEATETYKEHTQQLNRLPAVKRRSDEHMFMTARRMVTKYLKLDDNRVVLDSSDVKLVEEEQESKAYHGLSTIYRKRFMKGTLLPDPLLA